MHVDELVGRSTQGKPINLVQLQEELAAAGLAVSGLGMTMDVVFTYNQDGQASDFRAADQTTVDRVIADHVGMRDKTAAEYSAEFQNPETTLGRKQEIRDVQNGLLPAETVPMTP